MAHAHDALAGLAGHGKGFRQQLIEGLALGQALAELRGLGAQLLVGKRQHLLFERIDGFHRLEHAFDFPLVLAAKEFFQERRKHIDWFFHAFEWRATRQPPAQPAAAHEEGILLGIGNQESDLVQLVRQAGDHGRSG